jgi:hypothetical protein
MKIDMHVHTSRHSGCAVMTPEQMAEAAVASGLDGVVMCEHDYLWTVEEAADLQTAFPPLKVFRGVEVSTREGHFLAYGIDDDALFAPQMPPEELIRRVRKAGGIVAVAHPGRYKDEVPDAVFSGPVDAIEVASGSILAYAVPTIERVQARLNAPGIAGSDGHDTWEIGLYATDFAEDIRNESELVEAVRSRRFEIYRNAARLAKLNEGVAGQTARAREALATGLSADEIWQEFGIAHSIQYGVRDGKDMRFV